MTGFVKFALDALTLRRVRFAHVRASPHNPPASPVTARGRMLRDFGGERCEGLARVRYRGAAPSLCKMLIMQVYVLRLK